MLEVDWMHSKLMRGLSKAAGFIGVGLVTTDDPSYMELCALHRQMSLWMRSGDSVSILGTMARTYCVLRQDGLRLERDEVERVLRERLAMQILSDYREEPAHFVIRGDKATVATRVYSKSLCRRDGRVIELVERCEHVTLWVKGSGGWKRVRTKIRFHEQNTDWAPEPIESAPAKVKREKFID